MNVSSISQKNDIKELMQIRSYEQKIAHTVFAVVSFHVSGHFHEIWSESFSRFAF